MNEKQDTIPTLQPFIGISLMLGAMALFPISDGIMKHLTATHSIFFLSCTRFLGSTLVLLPVTFAIHKGKGLSQVNIRLQTIRALFLVGAALFYFKAIAQIPLANALGGIFVAPILATIVARFILHEPLDRRKLVAVLLGFIGSIIVVQPGVSTDIGMLYALGAGFLTACFLVTTRMVTQTSPPLIALAFQSIFGVVVLTPFIWQDWAVPNQEHLILIILMALVAIMSHLCLINSLRFAQVSTLSPFSYFELVGATLIGFFFFDDFPSVITWSGIALIILGGLSLIERKEIAEK